MSFRLFKMNAGGASLSDMHPFKAIVSQSTSGLGQGNLDAKCPCDTGIANYTSSHFFKFSPGQIAKSGKLSVKVFSGSMLYSSMNLEEPYIHSYAAQSSEIKTEEEKNSGVMRIFGLDYPIFIEDFLGKDSGDSTLKIWLTVCYPSGQPEQEDQSSMESADPEDFTLHDCRERANKPLGAFISCSTENFPKSAEVRLINKGTALQPRYEKRQVAANIPIAEINRSGVVLRQFLNSNLTLVDMNVGGFPCKMPTSIFSEKG